MRLMQGEPQPASQGDWRKPGLSFSNGNCLEVASLLQGGGVLVRDTKNRDGAVLAFSPAAWRAFTGRLRGA